MLRVQVPVCQSKRKKKCITQSSCIQQHNKIRVIIHLKTRNVPRKFSVILYAKIQIIKRVSNCLMVKYIKKSGKLRMTTHDFPLYGTAPLFHYKFVKGTTHWDCKAREKTKPSNLQWFSFCTNTYILRQVFSCAKYKYTGKTNVGIRYSHTHFFF